MSRTKRNFKGEEYSEKTRRGSKDQKFFGYSEDNWDRPNGKHNLHKKEKQFFDYDER